MTDKPMAPTDAEIVALADATRTAEGGANGYILPISFARAVLAKWGTPPAVAGEPVAWMGTYDKTDLYYRKPPQADVVPLYTTPQPTQAQAGAVPLDEARRWPLQRWRQLLREERMTTNEIIAMAREADPFGEDGRLFAMASVAPGTLERFAALVAEKEREACAQVCESWGGRDYEKCATAIRERNSHVA